MDGFIYWYEKNWSAASALHALIRAESIGLLVAETEASRPILAEKLALTDSKLETVTYQIRGDSFLHCGFRRINDDLVVQEFDFFDLPVSDCHKIFTDIVELFNQDHSSTAGFIADRTGQSNHVDWDDVVLGKPAIVTTRPDILALPTTVIQDSHPELQGLVSRRLRKLSIYRGNDLAARIDVD